MKYRAEDGSMNNFPPLLFYIFFQSAANALTTIVSNSDFQIPGWDLQS